MSITGEMIRSSGCGCIDSEGLPAAVATQSYSLPSTPPPPLHYPQLHPMDASDPLKVFVFDEELTKPKCRMSASGKIFRVRDLGMHVIR